MWRYEYKLKSFVSSQAFPPDMFLQGQGHPWLDLGSKDLWQRGKENRQDLVRIRPWLNIPGQSPTFYPVPCYTPRDTEPVPTEHKAA